MQKNLKISIVALLVTLVLTACSGKGTDTKIATESKDTAINKEQSFQEASDFVKAYNDTASKMGVFTASNGDMYEIVLNEDDLVTVGPLVENYGQLLAQRQKADGAQEAIAFVKTINALAAFTLALDAADLAQEAIEDMGMGSYSNGVFTDSNGTSYVISFDGDTATLENME
jgi:ABC-type Fe3+-hydroxamate transport system substrate-binding protein